MVQQTWNTQSHTVRSGRLGFAPFSTLDILLNSVYPQGLLKTRFRDSTPAFSSSRSKISASQSAALHTPHPLKAKERSLPVYPSASYLTPPPSDDSDSSATPSEADGSMEDLLEFEFVPASIQPGITLQSATSEEDSDDMLSSARSLRPRKRANSTPLGKPLMCTRRAASELTKQLRYHNTGSNVQVKIASYNEGLPAIARASHQLAQKQMSGLGLASTSMSSPVSVDTLDEMLLCEYFMPQSALVRHVLLTRVLTLAELPPPKLLIIHNTIVPSLYDVLSPPRLLSS